MYLCIVFIKMFFIKQIFFLQVAWIKSDSKAILAIHTHMVAHDPRLSVTHNGHDTWRLHVTHVRRADSGAYMCQINTDPMRNQVGYITYLYTLLIKQNLIKKNFIS